jgi:hypothetical protein
VFTHYDLADAGEIEPFAAIGRDSHSSPQATRHQKRVLVVRTKSTSPG